MQFAEEYLQILNDLLVEGHANFLSTSEKTAIVDEIWEMLDRAYAKAGGFKSAINKQDLIDNTFIWKIVRNAGKIISVIISKDTKFGRKLIALATDSSNLGKHKLASMIHDEVVRNHTFCEVSGSMENFALKQCSLGMYKVPNMYAAQLTGKEILKLHPDKLHYDRLIQGHQHTKMIVGNPKNLKHG